MRKLLGIAHGLGFPGPHTSIEVRVGVAIADCHLARQGVCELLLADQALAVDNATVQDELSKGRGGARGDFEVSLPSRVIDGNMPPSEVPDIQRVRNALTEQCRYFGMVDAMNDMLVDGDVHQEGREALCS